MNNNLYLKMLAKFLIFTVVAFLPCYLLHIFGMNSKLALILSLSLFVIIVFVSKTIKFSEIKLILKK